MDDGDSSEDVTPEPSARSPQAADLRLTGLLAEYRELQGDKRQYYRLAVTALGFMFAASALMLSVLSDDTLPAAIVVIMVSVATFAVAGFRSFIEATAIQAAELERKVNLIAGEPVLTWETVCLRSGGTAGQSGVASYAIFILALVLEAVLIWLGFFALIKAQALTMFPPPYGYAVQVVYVVLDLALIGGSGYTWIRATQKIRSWQRADKARTDASIPASA